MGRCELSGKLSFERYHWFHGQIKANRYPNARSLAGHFEISTKQAVSIDSNGNLFLRIPVADFREIRHEILKFGSSVEVLSPEELRNEIKKEIEKMSMVYR